MSLTGLVLPAQQQGPAPDRSDDRSAAPVAARSSTRGYDRQPNYTIGLTNNFRYKRASLELPVRHPEGRRRLQRHRALPHDARPRHEHARSQHAARHRRACCATARRTPPIRRRTRSSSCPAMQTALLHEHERGAVHREEHQLAASPRRDARVRAARAASGDERQRVRHGHGPVPVDQLHGSRSDRERQRRGGRRLGGVGIDYGNFPIPRGINFGFRLGF